MNDRGMFKLSRVENNKKMWMDFEGVVCDLARKEWGRGASEMG